MTVDIANRLVQLRKDHKLSQEELAEKLGLSRQAVSKWERAEASPDTDNLIMLSKLYGVSLDELLKTDEDGIQSVEQSAMDSEQAQKKRERVHIGFKGIHVEDGENYVHVGWDGIRVEDDEGHKVNVADGKAIVDGKEYDYKHEMLKHIPVPIIVTIAYLVMGFQWNLWHPGWLVFLLVPIFESLFEAILRRDAACFAYPVLMALVFLCLGFFASAWHPGWVVFLTVPIYYMIFAKKPKDSNITFGKVPDDLKDEF